MKKTGVLLASIAVATLASCGEGLLKDMRTPLVDPIVAVPVAASFVAENRIDVSWSRDPGASQYVLERAKDSATPVYAIVYQGTSTSYTDASVSDQGRYLYRLTKTRGTRSFGPSDAALAVASTVCRDRQEPNDSESQAAVLESTLAANLYYYSTTFLQNGAPLVEQDADWYSVTVPANSTANIVVTQTQPELADGTRNTWMYFYLKAGFEMAIPNSQPIPVENFSNSRATFLFKISPIPSCFPANGGGSLVNYTVKLYSITGN